jgi:hypothetical protein
MFRRLFVTIFRTVVIIGGIASILGGLIAIFSKTPKLMQVSWIIVLIGGIVGGGNTLSIIGAVQLKKSML